MNELGAAYLGQMAAKQMVHEALYGSNKPKKSSRLKAMIKKIIK